MSPAALSGVALMGRTLVLHVPLFSPVARSPALLVFTCSPWKRAAKDPPALRQKRRFRTKPKFFSFNKFEYDEDGVYRIQLRVGDPVPEENRSKSHDILALILYKTKQ